MRHRTSTTVARLVAAAACCVLAAALLTAAQPPAINSADPSTDSAARQTPVGGPNVCRSRFRNYCCPGWTLKHATGLCIVPVCNRPCNGGRCIKPNMCLCDEGSVRSACLPDDLRDAYNKDNDQRPVPPDRIERLPAVGVVDGEKNTDAGNDDNDDSDGNKDSVESGGHGGRTKGGGTGGPSTRISTITPLATTTPRNVCKYPCLNGGTCLGSVCACRLGYNGENCGDPICRDGCLNGGRCIGPDRCACVYGYAGRRCEADYRIGPCFTRVINDMCQGQLEGVVCTKQLCCATIGLAWGHPCEQCSLSYDCDIGFLKNLHSNQCIDIDECEAIPGICKGGACVNTVGSFKCVCPEGRIHNQVTNVCDDENECKRGDPNICQDGYCVNTDSSYYCICKQGFVPTADRKGCIDTQQGNCFTRLTSNGDCSEPLPIKLSKKDCCCGKDMGKGWGNTCEHCPTQGIAEYVKLCLGGIANQTVLNLVDECGLRPEICGAGGRCIDTVDGYACECFSGFTKSRHEDSQVCEDINECSQQGICNNGQCSNTPGSFICSCPPGYDLASDGKRCIDHNECEKNGMCANGKCLNVQGSFQCRCKSGFVMSQTGHSCIDVDECYENPKICLNGKCRNTPGSYICECQPGYTVSPDGTFCTDTNECEKKPDLCRNGKCANTDGSYKCLCDSGYRLSPDRQNCIDIDECSNAGGPCQNGKCINTAGSYRCECQEGFYLGLDDGRTCLDTLRDICYANYQQGSCLQPLNTPVTKSSCCCSHGVAGQTAGWGSPCAKCPAPDTVDFKALCPQGTGMTYNGDDINECAQNPAVCSNGACENTIGNYRCICNAGYEVDDTGKSCKDINECDMDDTICNGGQCRNTPGSFQCTCPDGTVLNSQSQACEDVNECDELGLNACVAGQCINTVGSFECECPPGTILDSTGRVCLDNRRGSCWTRLTGGRCENNLMQLTLKSDCCCSIGLAWGSPCEPCKQDDCGGECNKGYVSVGKMCRDINECELSPGICRGGGTCVNTEGSFTCVCPPGLTLDTTGTVCLDVREEKCYTDFKHGAGVNPLDGLYPKSICCCSNIGKAWGGGIEGSISRSELCPRRGTPSFTELCPKGPGFIDRKDINECIEFPGICSNGRCKNTMGGFTCKCSQGYALDESGIRCVDIDECSIMHGVCGDGECQNVPGSFVCKCKEGYETSQLMQVCMDIDECERTPGLCRGGTCKNTPGSYKCECPPGHELSADKQSCKDIDECSRTSGICSNGVCENMMGTYQCVCDDGYRQTDQKFYCEDINECETNNGGCSSLCINVPGSYTCSCKTGFNLLADRRTCADVDECEENPRICNGGQCNNTIGSFLCSCSGGLLKGDDGSSCLDINECDEKDVCGNGVCSNTIGSFTCRCEEGYSAKLDAGPACTDEDECEMGTHRCDVNAACINNPGSYGCRCQDGFTGNGYNCMDINECLTNNGGCDQNAQCINEEGSSKCICDDGFRGDGYTCTDIDECTEDSTLCENGHCLNYPGSFRCECEMGFINPDDKNEKSCNDINECQMFNNLCVYGNCENIFGTFRCECNEGYQLDNTGGNCTDVNECESPQACLYGECINNEGNYTCKCPPNYQLVAAGNACVDRREGRCYMEVEDRGGQRRCHHEMGSAVSKATCCCSVGKAWGSKCELCPGVDTEEYKTLCPGGTGYRPNPSTVILEDLNECEEHDHLCENGHCTNTFGSYMCSCNEGYRLDNTSTFCYDVDECNERPDVCGAGFCVNDVGTYHCVCPEGYMLLPNGKECVDMRKENCFLNYTDGQCSVAMSNSQTRMICCCSMGQAWGLPCQPCPASTTKEYLLLCGSRPGLIMNPMTNRTEEIDECTLMPNMCNHGTCVNTPGSFHCSCDSGYVYDANSHQCIDDNECLRIPPPCRGIAQCVNTPGSFECQCPEGYKLGTTARECVDIDECYERDGICRDGECTNLDGSFQCICHNGYALTASRDTCVDVDECSRHPNVCNNGTCLNSVGSFKCNCSDGFKLSHNNDCIDVDECRMMPFLCRNGRCRNTMGAFSCECTSGYTLSSDNQHCRDIDECTEIPGTCPLPGRCQNLMGSFLCTCPPGYRLSAAKNSCLDINECREMPGICEGGTCTNTDGGVICDCPEGFVLSSTGMKCIDTRQDHCYDLFLSGNCLAPRKQRITEKECCCSSGGGWGKECTACPKPGSDAFARLCPEGVGRGDKGEDLNECDFMTNPCDGGECINTDGSYRCECPAGYVLDSTGKKCVDENECKINVNICGNGTCANLQGGFECICADGFAPGPTQVCEDVNECLEMSNQCAFRCHNVPGSFRCICPYGYALAPDGRHCQDVDECVTPANNCKFECKNLIGSFACICPEGYAQIGSDECRDINECAENPNICQNGFCVNLSGTYKCDCYDGFKASYDGRQCIDSRVGLCYRHLLNGRCINNHGSGGDTTSVTAYRAVTKADCCCSMAAAWGPQCQPCPSPSSDSFRQLCLESGYTIDGQDINECETLPDLCTNGRCINTLGSYRCSCNKAYKIDRTGTHCNDVNECLTNPPPCEMSCQNLEGGFACGCPPGFLLNADNSTCRDLDECSTGQHICQQLCINTHGSYKCGCQPGYRQSGDHCLDIDECRLDPNVCHAPSSCVNTLGSFRCACPRHYKLDSTGTRCVDPKQQSKNHQFDCIGPDCDNINNNNNNNNNNGCHDRQNGQNGTSGTGNCGCPKGFRKLGNRGECVDVNECLESPCDPNLNCINTPGGYQCVCSNGQIYDPAALGCGAGDGRPGSTASRHGGGGGDVSGRGCYGSPCAFGCTPLGHSGFSCGCPAGYQRIGQGHCLSTISPITNGPNVHSPPDLGDIPTFAIEPELYPKGAGGKIISTEGCFSCKINGDGRFRHRRTANVSSEVMGFNDDFDGRWQDNPTHRRTAKHKHRHRREDGAYKTIRMKISDAVRNTRILKLLPAVKDNYNYFVVPSSDATNKFKIKRNSKGIWGLHFRRNARKPGKYHLAIDGQRTAVDGHTERRKPPILHVKLIVSGN
ncbi:fibrillin-2-like isoform X2 [Sipha flava]|uniref:Fibrillin-2-like isoform X2 n=1 Tax=Sipha flava TaxID=143950 RepID=A0A8B8FM73_9HEMI|nr:fibrillin-2-like isoform X2 [Sipha flava]